MRISDCGFALMIWSCEFEISDLKLGMPHFNPHDPQAGSPIRIPQFPLIRIPKSTIEWRSDL